MNNYSSYKARGFTLIELLVVIAIIGVLATIVTVSLSSARSKPRDAKRLADLKSFQLAVDSYFSANDHYPYTNCAGTNDFASFDSPTYAANQVCDTVGGAGVTLAVKLSPYIATLRDPKNLGTDSGYLYFNQGGAFDYCILINGAPENLNNFSTDLIPATRCSVWDSAGQCSAAGTASGPTNAIYVGRGIYASGC
ncbi:MAG TPA: type II secretion system protein [Candidatus Paceibacterota bacterium]